jgi:hypothetical protein
MDHSGIDIRREDANPAREASQVSSCRSILVVLWGRLRMYLSIGPRFRSEMHCRNCGDGNIPPLVLNNYVGHWTTMLATGHLLWPLDRRANTCRRWHVGKEKAQGRRQVWVVAIRSGRDWSQALESKVRFADKPPRTRTNGSSMSALAACSRQLTRALNPMCRRIYFSSIYRPTHCRSLLAQQYQRVSRKRSLSRNPRRQ